MSENYSRSLLRIAVAQICQNLGWNSAQSSSLEVLTDVLERYLLQLGGVCHRYSEQFGRTEANLDDLGLAFKHMCIDVSELEDYVRHVDPVPFAHEHVAFPARKSSNLEFPNPQSREILLHREEHVDSHLPYMFQHLKDEIPSDNQTNSMLTNVPGVKEEPETEDPSINGECVGEKRPAVNGALELPASKRQRIGNPSLPEEAGQSQYEMTCVFMNQNGVLTTRPDCQGKLPEARLPPPNPRNISENNKENKNKDSSNGTKISISGGIGADAVVVKSKSGKKSSHKKGLHIHESAARAALEMTSKEIGKKSASSKAAAKFLKKLKSSKKSAKIFGKKHKDIKSHEDLNMNDSHDNTGDVHKGKGTKRKKKEKKSAAIVDSDEELRNLSSPSSSKVPSPEHSANTGSDGGEKHKAVMDAVRDSINAVLREGRGDHTKVKKKKKKEGKINETPVNSKEVPEAKPPPKRKGRPPGRKTKEKKPEPTPPPPVDIKPFVSEKYSSAELLVYEFNDSPPDASSMKGRRPSAPDDNSSSKATTNATTHSSSHGQQKSVKIVEQEELFAPEIKIESRDNTLTVKPLKLDLNKEKEKGKTKDEKKEKSTEEKDKHKMKTEKDEKRKDKSKENDNKEKLKDKEIRKDKKDKKKDKEKKKKHKEKERGRDKEKEKRRDEKMKQEARESRESSPVVGHGVKLTIKIGGSAGHSASMMVTGEDNPASPSPSAPPGNSKRESMSPPKVVPKLYITKKGQEEKTKKSVKHGSKSSPLSVSVKSGSLSPSSNAASPSLPTPQKIPSPTPSSRKTTTPTPSKKTTTPTPSKKTTTPTPSRKTPIPTPSRKTPTPMPSKKTPTPPPFAQYSDHKSHSPAPKDSKEKGESPIKEKPKKGKGGRLSRKDKDKKKAVKSSSSSAPTVPNKSPKPRVSPKVTRQSSSSLEHSPPRKLPPQSPKKSKSRSTSPASHHNASPPPPLSRRKPPPSAATSKGTTSSQRHQSPSPHLSPSRPPTPGSTSPDVMMDWNMPESPLHNSPLPTVPNTPIGSPHRSPSHSSLPRTPNPHRSPSPIDSPHTSPVARTGTPEARTGTPEARTGTPEARTGTPEARTGTPDKLKDPPSPASSGKSSTGGKSRTVEAETVCVFFDDTGQKVWICPACKLQDDGSDMIGCDRCDNWYHWPCVGITAAPPEEQSWFCPPCTLKAKTSSRGGSRGRGRPRGRGRGRGRKKIT